MKSSNGQGNDEEFSQLKEIIVEKSLKRIFENNPLLSTTHFVTCQKCKYMQNIIYLNFLKTGKFEIGKTEQIQAIISQGIMDVLENETVTPIIISIICDKCGFKIEVKPISVEYLKFIINRSSKTLRTMYV